MGKPYICYEERNNKDKIFEEVRMLDGFLTREIREVKRQIWRITYYILILQASVITFYSRLNEDSITYREKYLIYIAGALISIIGILFLGNFQNRLLQYRNIIKYKIRPYYSYPAIYSITSTDYRIQESKFFNKFSDYFDLIYLAFFSGISIVGNLFIMRIIFWN